MSCSQTARYIKTICASSSVEHTLGHEDLQMLTGSGGLRTYGVPTRDIEDVVQIHPGTYRERSGNRLGRAGFDTHGWCVRVLSTPHDGEYLTHRFCGAADKLRVVTPEQRFAIFDTRASVYATPPSGGRNQILLRGHRLRVFRLPSTIHSSAVICRE